MPVVSMMSYPLYGIVYNWKCLKEENYLYTADELSQMDPDLLSGIRNSKEHYAEGAFWANKTYTGFELKTPEEVKRFLTGSHNGLPCSIESDSYRDDLREWYWESCILNDLFGQHSDTMELVASALNIPIEEMRGDGNREAPDYMLREIKLENDLYDARLRCQGELELFQDEETGDWYARDYKESLGGAFPLPAPFDTPVITAAEIAACEGFDMEDVIERCDALVCGDIPTKGVDYE